MIRWKIISVLLLCLVLAVATACSPGDKEETEVQPAKVVRGDLTVTVTGSGNIETSREARLSFGSGGKVDKIYVKEGDNVNEGDILATLDTSDLELALTQAQVALTQAHLSVTQAQLSLQTAEYNLKNIRDTEGTLELALLNAQIDIKNAEYNYNKVSDYYTYTDIRVAEADVAAAELYLEDVLIQLGKYAETDAGYARWSDVVIHAQARIKAAEDRLEAMRAGLEPDEVFIKKLLLEAALKAEAQAQKNLDDLAEDIAIEELQIESAKQSVEQAQRSVELAQQSLDQAQKDLDKATLTAPFDGVVASVDAEEGDTILTTTTIVHLIDPGSMELLVELDEIDIPEVRLNQEAVIEIDALPDTEFNGRVTAIYPVPTVEGGVVLYNVKIHLDATDDSRLRIGMSADTDIVINERSNVLLVPSRAIKQDSQGNSMVKVMVNEQTEERPVVIGISDGFETEIVEGLNEGETVAVER